MIESRVYADVLIEGLDDWVPIDQLIWAARQETGGGPWQDYFTALLHQLLDQGLIRIGELADEGFAPWSGDPDEIVRLVREDLARLSWEPKLGSRAWIANTEAGDEAARLLID